MRHFYVTPAPKDAGVARRTAYLYRDEPKYSATSGWSTPAKTGTIDRPVSFSEEDFMWKEQNWICYLTGDGDFPFCLVHDQAVDEREIIGTASVPVRGK